MPKWRLLGRCVDHIFATYSIISFAHTENAMHHSIKRSRASAYIWNPTEDGRSGLCLEVTRAIKGDSLSCRTFSDPLRVTKHRVSPWASSSDIQCAKLGMCFVGLTQVIAYALHFVPEQVQNLSTWVENERAFQDMMLALDIKCPRSFLRKSKNVQKIHRPRLL